MDEQMLRATSDSALLDDIDTLYDLMVAAGEHQDSDAQARYRQYHDTGVAEARRRGIIEGGNA